MEKIKALENHSLGKNSIPLYGLFQLSGLVIHAENILQKNL